jgi:crossover junction endonuclease MUS81
MEDDECANPKLLAWVKEWLDLAREQNSKGVNAYKKAYDSLKACPIVFQHPEELRKLSGFGEKLCARLTEKLRKQCQQDGLPMPEHPQTRRAADRDQAAGDDEGEPSEKTKRKPRQPKSYVPAFRSGGYAIILGLSTQPEDASLGMTKAELIEVAQPHCDSSFSAPSDPTKFYTAWNSIKTLLQKELVYERGRPLRRYALTDEGWDVVGRIKETRQWQAENGEPGQRTLTTEEDDSGERRLGVAEPSYPPASRASVEPAPEAFTDIVSSGPAVSGRSDLPSFTSIVLPPGSFTVKLLLDVREVRAKTDRDYMKEELAKQGVTPIMRSLEVGDAQWVAKCNDPNALIQHGAEGDEVVLDWIVERKRLDDLVSSVKDGRFHEQKFRLRRSGARKVIYIIEDIAMDPLQLQRHDEMIKSAIASTQVVNGYFVKRTIKMDDTIKYLARMTAMLKRSYERKPLKIIPTRILTAQNYLPLLQHLRESNPNEGHYITYPAFASLASKSELMTLRDVFLKMLMTTKGLTGERALEIQKKWKTPYDLVKAFEACGSTEQGEKRKRDLVASEMGHLIGRKKFSKPLSQKIAEVWGDA